MSIQLKGRLQNVRNHQGCPTARSRRSVLDCQSDRAVPENDDDPRAFQECRRIGDAIDGSKVIEIKVKEIGGVQKLCIWNTGPGMSSEELHGVCDLAASLGKDKGLDENFGMGAKVASLPSNRYGLRYRSCKQGVVSEVILCERDGVYGRYKRELPETGTIEEVVDVTEVCKSEGYDLAQDWTEVVLFGNRADQDTVRDPYDGNPAVQKQWIADTLYHRFYRLPEGLLGAIAESW